MFRFFMTKHLNLNFLGKAWTKTFKEIFSEKSRYVVCLLDKHHAEKIWPTFEREHFAPRVADEHVIPIFLDDTSLVGIPIPTSLELDLSSTPKTQIGGQK